jgi:hypothetical protein
MAKKRSKPNRVVGVLLAIVVFAVIVFLVYSVVVFERADVEEAGLEVCVGDECVKTLHIHAEIEVINCGVEMRLPLEAGALEKPHTHKERNLIHSPHVVVPLDPVTKEPLISEGLSVGEFFDSIGWRVTEECVQDVCRGATCRDKPGEWVLSKNGERQSSIRDTSWVDDDVLELRFE